MGKEIMGEGIKNMKFLHWRSWKIWVPVMLLCLVGFGLTGPATQKAAKREAPKMYEMPNEKKGMQPYAMIPPPVVPAPAPAKSNTLADIFFYGSGISILLNLLNFLEKLVTLVGRLYRKVKGLIKP